MILFFLNDNKQNKTRKGHLHVDVVKSQLDQVRVKLVHEPLTLEAKFDDLPNLDFFLLERSGFDERSQQ